MKRMVVFLAALVAGISVVVADAMIAPAPTPPPGGILVSVNPSHCYTPNAAIRIVVTNVRPGSWVQASSEETVSAGAKASAAGTAAPILSAPSGLAHGRSIEAHLLEVNATDATGQTASGKAAFVLATRHVCRQLKRAR